MELLEGVSSDEMVHAYTTRHGDGSVTLLIVNLNESATAVTIELEGSSLGRAARVTGVSTDDLEGSTMTVLDDTGADLIDGSLSIGLPGWSIVSIEVRSDD